MLILNSKTSPFWREKNFYKDKNPLPYREFVDKYLRKVPSPKQLEVAEAIVGTDPYEWERKHQRYVIAIGQGGGKNEYIIAPVLTYLTYRIGNMRDPYAYFDRFRNAPMDRRKNFDFINMSSVSADQAKGVHFTNMISLIRSCIDDNGDNWFEKYLGMDLREGGFGDIKEKKVFIPTIPECGKIVHHSFDSGFTAWEGLAIILAVNDEVSRAETKAEYSNVEKSWKGQAGNINSRFPNNVGKLIGVSYLNCSEFDFMHTLMQQAEAMNKETENPIIYYCNLATWDCNPNVSKDSPEIQHDYKIDPIASRARYEGIKGATTNSFYQPHPEKIKEVFFKMKSPVDYVANKTQRTVRDPNDTKREVVKEFSAISLNSITGDNRIRGIAIDPASKYDAFILKMGYIETMEELRESIFIGNEKELVVVNKRPIIDIVLAWQPQTNLPIDYLNVGDIIGELISAFPNTRFLYSDKYNSEKLSQEVIARGVHSETLGFGNAQQLRMYKKLRWLVHSNIPQIYADDDHYLTRRGIRKSVGDWNIEEHERLLNINDTKVDHPQGDSGSKDLADVDAILINYLLALEVNEGTIGVGTAGIVDPKIIRLAEKYMIARAKLAKAGIKPTHKEFIHKAAEMLNLTSAQTKTLKEYVDDNFPTM